MATLNARMIIRGVTDDPLTISLNTIQNASLTGHSKVDLICTFPLNVFSYNELQRANNNIAINVDTTREYTRDLDSKPEVRTLL